MVSSTTRTGIAIISSIVAGIVVGFSVGIYIWNWYIDTMNPNFGDFWQALVSVIAVMLIVLLSIGIAIGVGILFYALIG